MFQFNDQRFEPKYAYAFQMEDPGFRRHVARGHAGREAPIKWKKVLAISLSDKPFDTQALAKLDQPYEALDRMVARGSTVGHGDRGKRWRGRRCCAVSLPRSQLALQLDTSAATLTLDAPKEGKVSGRFVIKGDRNMHEFDPEHIPFVEADIRFVTAAPSR